MLDIISKKEYFRWYEEGIAEPDNSDLKGIQDAYILSNLGELKGNKIAEIGGGYSRVLEKLKIENDCWNIDKFEGLGAGPKEIRHSEGITIVKSYVGDFSKDIQDNYFDVIFSVSVVEHVEKNSLEKFFLDCFRMLKPNGVMIHAIDIYLFDAKDESNTLNEYKIAIEKAGFEWSFDPVEFDGLFFKCSYASCSDASMGIRNRIAPALREVREISQSVSIKAQAIKRSS